MAWVPTDALGEGTSSGDDVAGEIAPSWLLTSCCGGCLGTGAGQVRTKQTTKDARHGASYGSDCHTPSHWRHSSRTSTGRIHFHNTILFVVSSFALAHPRVSRNSGVGTGRTCCTPTTDLGLTGREVTRCRNYGAPVLPRSPTFQVTYPRREEGPKKIISSPLHFSS
jgi:hypothetical protein